MDLKLSVGLWCLGGCGDRYNLDGYSRMLPTEETIKLAGRLPGITGIEMMYPTGFQAAGAGQEATMTKDLLESEKLQVSSILVNTFSDAKWKLGSLGAADPHIRAQAVEQCKKAIEFAQEVGCPSISLWLGQDGFDYPFQIDYEDHWKHLVEGIREVARFDPGMKVSLEYKQREPRNRMTISSAAKSLVLIDDIGEDNVGVCMDFGHALACRENPGESVALLNSRGRLFNVHINDCYREWDDDMIVGTVHVWETLEFLYYVKKTNYTGWIGLDQFPYREDAYRACRQSVENLQTLAAAVEELDVQALKNAQATMDAVKTQELVRPLLFR